MPARSKSLRTQSAAVSVSAPSGMREAPPGAKGCPSYDTPRTGTPYVRSPAPPSLTATASRICVQGVESNTPSLSVSRSLPALPVKFSTSSRVMVPFSSALAASEASQKPLASVVPTAITSSTVPVAAPESPSISRMVRCE